VSSAVAVAETGSTPDLEEGTSHAEVSNTLGGPPSQQGIAFGFHNHPVVMFVSPARARAMGGTKLTVTGEGFRESADLACHVGAVAVRASAFTSMNFVECVTPGLYPGANPLVEMSNNRKDYSLARVPLLVFDNPEVVGLSPARGPTNGGTELVVEGTSFVPKARLVARFDFTTAPSYGVTSADAVVYTPPHPAGFVSLEVSIDEGNYTTSGYTYQYQGAHEVLGLTPDVGPVAGGTMVTAAGFGFAESDRGMCKFGQVGAAPAQTRFVSTALVACESPTDPDLEFNQESSGGAATDGTRAVVEVSLNGQDFSSSQYVFTYKPEVSVSTLTPSTGSTKGGTVVTVTGSGFTGNVWCRFGTIGPLAGTRTSAVGQVTCQAPAHAVASVYVEAAHAGVYADYSTDQILFEY